MEHAVHEVHIPITVLYQAINVTILIGLLYFLTSKKIRAYFTSRGEQHFKAKEDARKAFNEAERKHEDLSRRLRELGAQEAKTVERAQADALLLKSKLIREAEGLAKNIVEDAKKTAHYEFEKAKLTLREEALGEALTSARASIQKDMTPGDQKNLQKLFIDSVETVQ